MPVVKGYMNKFMQMLSEKCCVTYDDLRKAGVDKSTAWSYTVELERRGVVVRVYEERRVRICLKFCVAV
jgi:hypothetical protein